MVSVIIIDNGNINVIELGVVNVNSIIKNLLIESLIDYISGFDTTYVVQWRSK